ncbi:hypothetical protein ScPMuIL_014527 [Solemya velum]
MVSSTLSTDNSVIPSIGDAAKKMSRSSSHNGETLVSSSTHDHQANTASTTVENIKSSLRESCKTQTHNAVSTVYNNALEEIAEWKHRLETLGRHGLEVVHSQFYQNFLDLSTIIRT